MARLSGESEFESSNIAATDNQILGSSQGRKLALRVQVLSNPGELIPKRNLVLQLVDKLGNSSVVVFMRQFRFLKHGVHVLERGADDQL